MDLLHAALREDDLTTSFRLGPYIFVDGVVANGCYKTRLR